MIPILFFDLETTGTSITKDRIVQISAVKVDPDNNFNIIEGSSKNILINPTFCIPAEATKVHGITDAMVIDKPVFQKYSNSMFAYFSGVTLAGYNIRSFDVPLLSEEFARCNISWPAKDLKTIDAFSIFRLKEKRDLATALKFYAGEVLEGAHNAENDNLATLKVLKGQLAMYPELATMDINQLHDFCSDGKKTLDLAGKIGINANGEAYYTFGKAINKLVRNDTGFANWMLKNDFSNDTKNVVTQLLKK